MISFRNHVVSLVAVFLALAVGVALGGGPLSSTADRAGDPAGTSGDPSEGSAPGSAPGTTPAAATYAERLAATAGARLYADGLVSAPVAVLAMPEADKDVLTSLSTQIRAAGGRVTGRYGVREALLDPEQRTLVDTLGSQLVTDLADSALDGSASTYERLGQLLGVGIATTEATPVAAAPGGLSVRESLSASSLMASPSAQVANAPLVLVVLGPETDLDPAVIDARVSLLGGLAATASGVVVLGDEASAADGTLAGLRGQPTPGVVATVDGADDELAQVSAVLALIGVLGGRSGAFGAASADGAVPLD